MDKMYLLSEKLLNLLEIGVLVEMDQYDYK